MEVFLFISFRRFSPQGDKILFVEWNIIMLLHFREYVFPVVFIIVRWH